MEGAAPRMRDNITGHTGEGGLVYGASGAPSMHAEEPDTLAAQPADSTGLEDN